MAIKTTTTKVLRNHMALGNGGTRYIDIDNPIENTALIQMNITALSRKLGNGGDYNGILASEQFFNGDTDATVTSITGAEIIETVKTVTTTGININP